MVGGWFCEGRYEPALPWASPEGGQAGGIFRGRTGARKCRRDFLRRRASGSGLAVPSAEFQAFTCLLTAGFVKQACELLVQHVGLGGEVEPTAPP